jgi:hypothetical protein
MSPSKQKTTASSTTGKKQPAKKTGNSGSAIADEQRYRMVQEAAYFIAEKAGFKGDNLQYWLSAEKEIGKKFK